MLAESPNGSASSMGSYGSNIFPLVILPPYCALAPACDTAPCEVLGFALICGCGIPAVGRGGAENDEVGKVDTTGGCSFGS